jgi:hypothetical protein
MMMMMMTHIVAGKAGFIAFMSYRVRNDITIRRDFLGRRGVVLSQVLYGRTDVTITNPRASNLDLEITEL